MVRLSRNNGMTLMKRTRYPLPFAIGLLVQSAWLPGPVLGQERVASIDSLNLDAQSKSLLDQVNEQIRNIDTEQFNEQIAAHPDTVVIDVRTEQETQRLGTMGLYQNQVIPRGWLEFRIANAVPDKDTPIVVYCGVNARSPLAAKTLMDMGYRNVMNYADGFFTWEALGGDVYVADRYPESFLYARPEQVVPGVWSAIGAPQPPTYENAGHNNNLSFVIGDEAVLVFNAGGSYLLAKALHEEIRKITDLPVKYVVLENAQGHAMLGSDYWQQQGAEVIAHGHTAELMQRQINLHEASGGSEGAMASKVRILRDKMSMTRLTLPDRTFEESLSLDLGNRKVELMHFGPSHSPDDIQLWLPESKVLISGDFTFNTRMLPILGHTDPRGWIESWEKLEALAPKIIVPGHGGVTDLNTVRDYTMGYLKYMVGEVDRIIEDGGSLTDAYEIDQSAFMQWRTFRELYRQNAARLFRMLEFE